MAKCRGRELASLETRVWVNNHVQLETVVIIWGFYLQLVLKGELMFELGHMNPHHPEPESLKV